MANDVQKAAKALLRFALDLPEAWEDHPWGETVAKVRKKVFVFMGHPDHNQDDLVFSVKLPESGVDLLDRPEAEPSGYGLGKHGWVSVRFSPGSVPDLEEMTGWIEESYRSVAPKKLVKELDARGE